MTTEDDLVEIAAIRSMCRSGQARRVREGAHISLTEMGSAVGVAISTLSRWETGSRLPKANFAIRYGKVLRRLLQEGGL